MSFSFILLFGIIVGVIAHLIDPRKNGSVIGPVIIGVLGSLSGSLLATMTYRVSEEGNLSILLFSVIVSTLLLLISWVIKPLQSKF